MPFNLDEKEEIEKNSLETNVKIDSILKLTLIDF